MRSTLTGIFAVVLIVILSSVASVGQDSSFFPDGFVIPPEMVYIPAGPFQMGDALNEGCSDEFPVHTVTLSAYYISCYEVTNDEMLEVLTWARANGRIAVSQSEVKNATGDSRDLLLLDEAQCRIVWNGTSFELKAEKASGYPCVEVTWYGAIAYCNYRSEMEGLTPCYNLSDWSCNWNANGYRLLTDAEWEKAARGGAEGCRFPWSDVDTIDHTRANYFATDDYVYDVSVTLGLHPQYGYDTGDTPYTSPVGSFPPNDYGIYDTAGNVWEWCWDYWDTNYYSYSPSVDPHGPSTGTYRVVRSGRWGYHAAMSRVSVRHHGYPGGRKRMGFRIGLSAG